MKQALWFIFQPKILLESFATIEVSSYVIVCFMDSVIRVVPEQSRVAACDAYSASNQRSSARTIEYVTASDAYFRP